MTLLLGGARSGKSMLAVRFAERAGRPVTYLATAQAGDEEMAARIVAHRAERPAHWHTVEDPWLAPATLAAVDPGRLVVVDCLTLWVANLLARPDHEILAQATRLADELARRPAGAVVVSNEVGSGIVPADPTTRRYRDLLGRVNAEFAAHADPALLVVAGRVLKLQSAEDLLG
jgi:adenosylcobinamide kinase/adenosylcobinamide-phosphate guanylyltransferase